MLIPLGRSFLPDQPTETTLLSNGRKSLNKAADQVPNMMVIDPRESRPFDETSVPASCHRGLLPLA